MKKIILHTIIIFIISTLLHFCYNLFPNFLISIFCPVNESIWEHLKMLFSASILASLGIGLIKHEPSFLLKGYLRGMFSIIILLIIYLPIYYTIGEHLILTMVILFISIFISELIVEKIKLEKHQQKNQILGAILIILNFIIFTYLTYNPIKVDLFYDHASKKYGIDILNK